MEKRILNRQRNEWWKNHEVCRRLSVVCGRYKCGDLVESVFSIWDAAAHVQKGAGPAPGWTQDCVDDEQVRWLSKEKCPTIMKVSTTIYSLTVCLVGNPSWSERTCIQDATSSNRRRSGIVTEITSSIVWMRGNRNSLGKTHDIPLSNSSRNRAVREESLDERLRIFYYGLQPTSVLQQIVFCVWPSAWVPATILR